VTFVITFRDIIGISFLILLALFFLVFKGLEWWDRRKLRRRRKTKQAP